MSLVSVSVRPLCLTSRQQATVGRRRKHSGADVPPRFRSHDQSARVLCARVSSVDVVWMERDSLIKFLSFVISLKRDSAVRSSVCSREVVVVAKKKQEEIRGQPVRETKGSGFGSCPQSSCEK